MEEVLQLAVVVFAALATGSLVVNWIGLGRAMSRLSVSAYVEFHQATNHTFDPYMPIVVVGALLGGIALAILSPGIHSLSGELAIAGFGCYAAVLAIALSTNVRINKQIARWSVQSPPNDWASIRARWIRFHIVRTLFFTSRTSLLHSRLSCESMIRFLVLLDADAFPTEAQQPNP